MEQKNRTHIIDQLKRVIDVAHGFVVIQAGHFAAIHDALTNTVVPGIYQELKNPEQRAAVQAHPYMGDFPLNTWELGVELAAYARTHNVTAKLIVICNDWQWIEAVESGKVNPHREKFHEEIQLPPTYRAILKKYELDTDVILPFKNTDGKIIHPIFFSERKLWKQYDTHMRGVCPLNNSCAQEYIPLLLQLQREHIKTFISFVPKTCLLSMNAGAIAAKNNFGVTMDIIHIFPGATNPENFWSDAIVTKF